MSLIWHRGMYECPCKTFNFFCENISMALGGHTQFNMYTNGVIFTRRVKPRHYHLSIGFSEYCNCDTIPFFLYWFPPLMDIRPCVSVPVEHGDIDFPTRCLHHLGILIYIFVQHLRDFCWSINYINNNIRDIMKTIINKTGSLQVACSTRALEIYLWFLAQLHPIPHLLNS